MGMPEVIVTFMGAASTAVLRSERGTAALILQEEGENVWEVENAAEAEEWFTAQNADYVKSALSMGARRVLCVSLWGASERHSALANTLNSLIGLKWDWLAYPEASAADANELCSFISERRRMGDPFKAVVYGAAAPNEPGVVNFSTASVTERGRVYTGAQYCAALSGLLAGLPLTRSATFYPLEGVSEASPVEDADAAIDEGKLIIVKQGGKYRLARGVTSYTGSDSECSKKIKHVEGFDMIASDIKAAFTESYLGQTANSYENKQAFVGAVADYLARLEGSVLDASYDNSVEIDLERQREYLIEHGVSTDNMQDIDIARSSSGSAVFLKVRIKPLDAMEDMTMSVAIS